MGSRSPCGELLPSGGDVGVGVAGEGGGEAGSVGADLGGVEVAGAGAVADARGVGGVEVGLVRDGEPSGRAGGIGDADVPHSDTIEQCAFRLGTVCDMNAPWKPDPRKIPLWAILVGCFVGGGAATFALQELSRSSARPALDESIAWQGWAGSMLGALTSVLVALYVLRVTVNTERERADAQARLDRDRFTEQIGHERRLAAESRLFTAWAEVLGALEDVKEVDASDPRPKAVKDMYATYWVWVLHLEPEQHDRFEDAMHNLLQSVLIRVPFALAEESMASSDEDPRPRRRDLVRTIDKISVIGTAWHRSPARRGEFEAKAEGLFADLSRDLPVPTL